MVNEFLVTLVNSVLGKGKKTSRGNYSYVCPFHISNPPGKHNFEVNFDENSKNYQKWGCWVCLHEAKGTKLKTLFKRLNVSQLKIDELKLIVKDKSRIIENNVSNKELTLPKEFKPFVYMSSNDLVGRHALSYLKSRGLTKEDIIKYNLGYCEEGKYSNMIIFPSYDENGKLNYFSGRSFENDSKRKLNPPTTRNIIPFEFFINWNLPIILCEGPIDAITIKRNAIPLLGKNIQSELMKKLILSKVDKIYITLDKDAQKQSLKYCEQLMKEGKEIYLVDLGDKDPNKLGFEHFTNLIQNTFPLTFSGLMEKKLSI